MMHLSREVGVLLRIIVSLCLFGTTFAADLPAPNKLNGTSSLGHAWNIKAQNDTLCDAGGKQWTGTVKVAPERTLFFWFFESRQDATKDPVILWLSGGPAASSMLGLFAEVGPCTTDGKTTKRLGPSWSTNANLPFVDQPAGTGFSTVTRKSDSPLTLAAAGQDFNILLHTFSTSIFPSLSKTPLHIAGESFGGRYVPAYSKYMIQRQESKAPDAVPATLESIILISASVDASFTSLGQIDHFCSDKKGNGFGSSFNTTTCAAMKRAAPDCEKQGQSCQDTMTQNAGRGALTKCDGVTRYFSQGVDRTACTKPPACRAKSFDQLVQYCNLPSVQAQLGFQNLKFEGINFDLNSRWTAVGDPILPANRDLIYLLDKTNVRFLVINGNDDVNVNTPGQVRALDALPWKGQSGYREQQFKPWSFRDGSGKLKAAGLTKGVERLLFVGVDNAGHEVPAGQPEAVLEVLQRWLKKEMLQEG
ncbi:carboxypeptidase Y [Tothia fuscella]|uniref:carboxypeptidase C n=1 Tax=Tothia fuscella TaxID=1048955 RepID=A0A9P4NUL5_9PEZI|nr:carboxypeptidase Y [Tothia fuscella]